MLKNQTKNCYYCTKPFKTKLERQIYCTPKCGCKNNQIRTKIIREEKERYTEKFRLTKEETKHYNKIKKIRKGEIKK